MANFRRPISSRRSIKKTKTGRYKARSASRYYTPPSSRSLTGYTPAGRISGLSRTDFGFPDRLRTKLHYCDVVQLAASAGNPGIYQFRLNSLFDPDFTGTGHQPQWFDQLSAVYQYYVVTGAKITVTFCPNNVSDIEANDKGPYIVGITTVGGTSTFSAASYPALLEDGNSVASVVVDKQGGNNAKTLTNTFSLKRDLNYDEVTLRSGVGSSPADGNTFFANLWCLDMTEAASQDMVAMVKIEFNCLFTYRKENVLS